MADKAALEVWISAKGMSKAQCAVEIRKQLALHSKYLRQHAGDPITESQRWYLSSKGIDGTKLNKQEAMKMISMLKKGIRPSTTNTHNQLAHNK